ncbi:MAG: pyruvate kinase [Candidatus Omnitrophica bacterium]|nr:pyruvate kinase [Candidatus Omnitrophota bacterium]
MARTKIICTLGPSSSTESVIRKMMFSGMDVARLNFSHAKQKDLVSRITLIRSLNKKYRRHIKLLGDLQGHRIRIGKLAKPLLLKKRQMVYLIQKDTAGSGQDIPFDYRGNLRDIKTGQHIFIDDGNIQLEVTGHISGSLKARVVAGGLLKEHKGVNIPEARLKFGGLSLKDREDIVFCQRYGIEYIAQSFVRTSADILEVRRLLKKDARCQVIAKIENREGIKNIDEIIKVSDGIMIARGDMGVSLPVYEIPVIQKAIIKKCNRAKKFVITATQMLESMTDDPRPTRAEVTDVANAIIDGTDFVMLSAESAVGRYPAETVTMMNNIIKFTEGYLKSGPSR